MTRSNENNSATWPDPVKNPDGWAQRAKRYLCALMNMQGSLFESVIEERDRIALECIELSREEGSFGNKSRLLEIHAREMAARAELRDGIAAQRAKEKAEVKLKDEKPKPAALDAAKKEIAHTLAQGEAAKKADAFQPEYDGAAGYEAFLTPAEDTPMPPKKSDLVENPERYKVVTAAGAYFENDLTLALKMGADLKGKVIDTQTNQHMNEAAPAPKSAKPARNEWITALGKREAFWAKAEENALKRGFERGDVHPIMHAACNVTSMYDFPGTGTEAMELFIAELEKQREQNAPEPPAKTEAVADEPKNGHIQLAPRNIEIPDYAQNPFQPATKAQARLRMALVGPSGSGKTYTALAIATNLVKNGKVAVIDTERGSASKYAKLFKFDTLSLESFSPQEYIKAIRAAEKFGYDVLVIDSLTHAWAGIGGLLEFVDKQKARNPNSNAFAAWRDATPLYNQLVDTMLGVNLHLLATMRSKTEYVIELNERGKSVPRKVGLAPVQRDGIEYEFDVFAEINAENDLMISKSRCPELNGGIYPKAGAEVASRLAEWLA